ncbi:hypothetical protein BY458DRAFT_585168 [Sporodiniella umbellata]|nr:hypothetical protein BY458DRAFT_585168 [Sporodiniella umbellata]
MSFPEGWFIVKNLNNGYVLSVEKSAVGEPVVISSLRKDIDSQLWQYGEDCRLHNKKTGFVLDIAKGVAKAGSNVVLQNDTDLADGQTFGITSDGLIHIVKNPNLVLGIKDSFFTRSEGQHVHLQLVNKNHKDRKEQRWELSVPSKRHSLTSHLSGSIGSLKRTISGASLGSSSSLHNIFHNEDDSHLDESAHAQLDNFPEREFFIKSELTGHFVSVEASALHSSGAKLCLEPLRTSSFESQLWHFDPVTHRLINKGTGFALTADDLADEASVSQSSRLTEKDLACQAWSLGASGTLRLKNSPHFLLGFRKDNWFNLNRDVASLLLQKADQRVHSYQKFAIALPIFKKTTAEIVSVTAQIGVFPEGHFFIKNQKHGLVVSVVETEKLAAQIVASPLDAKNYNRQLWSHKQGFLINKASQFVLDVRGGSISPGTELCQYKQKKVGYENQQWGLSVEGFIHTKKNEAMVLALDQNLGSKSVLALAQKKTPDHEEQRWNFVLPVFKHKSNPVAQKTVQKSIVYHRFALYPSGWFFIRSFAKDATLVLTASAQDDSLSLSEISHEHWRYQLWMHWNGGLINFATQLALATPSIAVGSGLRQDMRHSTENRQKWSLTTEGYLVHGANHGLLLVPEPASDGFKLSLIEQASVQHGHRWGLLVPETKVEHGIQILSSWKTSLLTEAKALSKKTTQVVHRYANWPEDTFYISAQEGYALAPEKLESYATLAIRKLEYGHYEQFQWTFRDGYLVHVATGLVLHAADELISGSELQIRERLTTADTIDARQRWAIKTDGTIVAETKSTLGFALLQRHGEYHVQLAYASRESEHYAWGFVHGHYETRYSNVYKKEMTVLTRLERILLTVRRYQIASEKAKWVTRSYGVFPENWFYIRSKADRDLVLTAPDKKQGSKLTVAKLDYKNFRRQLWHVEDEDCLKNLETGYVIDVAGGCLEAGNDAIQWHQKFLKIQRKNQVWGLSVDGHLHPKSRPGLVLGPKGNSVSDGAEIQLHTRGALELEYQRWTFAIPVFGRPGGVTSVGVLEGSDVFVDKTDDTEIKTTQIERYERTEKITIVRRWGLFPQEGFFIRSSYGSERFALTVEKKPRVDDQGRDEYAVSMRPIDYKQYKWHFWTYQEGRLINAQTGLALDASPLKGILVEDGLQSSLFVRQKSESTHQFWALTAEGELYLKADERSVIGVSSADRVAVEGAQVGIRSLRVQKSVNEKGQQITTLKSHRWLQWSFSKPVFGTRKTTTEEVSSALATATAGLIGSDDQEIEGLEDTQVEVKEDEESSEDYAPEIDSEEEIEESEDEEEEETDEEEVLEDSAKLDVISNLGIATAGAAIINNTPEASVDNNNLLKTQVTKQDTTQAKREETFHVTYDYVPTGYERVVRYLSHQHSYFPHEGYFMIKSYLHGYVLDVANNEARDGSYVVLAPIKTTNFASQLWSYRGGRLVNLKSHNLVLDASLNDTVVSGERVGLSTQKTAIDISDQHWEFDLESGVIHLAGKRSLVLSVKELTPQDAGRIDLFIQEEKSHQKVKLARAEQRWEIKVPAFVPVEKEKNDRLESNYTIIEAGKVSAISSTLSSVLAFEWLKSTFYHKMAVDNQWPSAENFFFVRIGNENAYLCSGTSVTQDVGFSAIQQKEDHKRYLWAFVDGYLVNYKYMLRLVFDKSTHKFSLTSNTDTLNQVFSLTSQGALSLKIDSETIHFDVAMAEGKTLSYRLEVSQEVVVPSKYPVQLHVPVFWNYQIEKEANVALSTITTWIYSSQKTTTTTITKNYRYGVFPNASWFYIKVDGKEEDSLVLASNGTSLVLDHLSFKDYKHQLWTFRDDALVNYGSKLVIDVNEGAIDSALLKVSAESGLGTQKWSLTAEGHIYLDSYADSFSIGADVLEKDSQLLLIQKDQSKAIRWKFSIPVFGKKPTAAGSEMATVAESISSSIEEGLMIETLEEVKTKVEEVFAKKPKQTKTSAKDSTHHDAHDILTNVGIVTGGAIAGAAVIGAIGKVADKLTEKHDAKKTKKTEAETTKVVIHHHNKTSAQVVQESQAIVRAWRIVFIRRIYHATSKTQLIQVIEESREDLFRRLDEHLRVYTSVEHMISGSVPDWHVSIEQVKELYRARVFERFLDRLHHEEIHSAQELDFDTVINSATEEVDRHYTFVMTEQSKVQTKVTEEKETSAHEHILTTVDTIKVRVRYWLVGLYETIAVAKEHGKSDEEIHSIVQESRQQLIQELSEVKTTAVSHVEQSSVLTENKTSLVNTIEKAVSQAETVVSKQVEIIATQKHYEISETYWLEITRTSEERLSSELKVYQTAITQEVTKVQNSKVSHQDQAEISVVLDEKMVGVAQQTVTDKLLETKTKLTSWFSQVTEQISWVIEASETNESAKKDALAIADAAQVELTARIEETKLVLRTYYSHLTYLSWAERHRIEYSLDSIKASLVANITHYKKSVEKEEITKEEISRFTKYSFGATVSRTLLLDLETIVTKIAKVKETVTVVNDNEIKKAEINKIVAISDKKNQETQKTTEQNKTEQLKTKAEEIQSKVDHVNKEEQTKLGQHTKVEADQTKIIKTETDKGKSTVVQEKKSKVDEKPISKTTLATAGAAASALASVLYQHHESKKDSEMKEKPAVSQPVGDKKHSESKQQDQKTQKQQKADKLVVVYDQVNVTVQEWVTKLNHRVVECVQKKPENVQEEIDTIVYESQQELVVAIEKAKRTTTSVIGTSQTSFHNTFGWIRGTVWKATSDIKRIAVEATHHNTEISVLEEKLGSVKKATLTQVTTAIEESKTSAVGLIDHTSTATIAVGKKFEGVDYSKNSHGEHVEQIKVSVGILIEDTRTTVQNTLNELGVTISERRKQGGDHLQADIEAIVQKSRQDITNYIQNAKTLFEKRTKHTESSEIQVEIVKETNEKVQVTLDQIQQSVLTQVSKVEEVSTIQVSEVEYTEKITSACQDAFKHVDAALTVSETIIGHHAEVVAESNTSTAIHENKEKVNASLGVEYGLVVISETTKTVSAQVATLIERIQHQVISQKDTVEQDVKTTIHESNAEIDRVFDEAKTKIEYELSMVASHEKVQEEHFITVIEEMRTSTKKRISQVHEVALSKQETLSEKLLQIAEESRHDVSSRLDSFRKSVLEKVHSVKDSVATEKKTETAAAKKQEMEDHKSKIDMAEKVLAGAAAVVATTTIAAEVAKKVSEHKEKVEKEKKQKQETALVVEDIKNQYKQWLATLTETVTKQCKESVSHEEIKVTIEKSKTDFLEVIQKTKTNTLITEKHQQEVLVWVEQTTISQATRIQEIVVQSSSSTVIDVESRLEVLKISTIQEVESALEKIKSSTTKFVGTTVDQLKQKESALLDVKSELSLVVHDARSSVVTFFETFTKSVIARVQQGGDNVSKDVSILVADARKQITVHIENVKNTATKKLSSLETKSTVSVVSIAALSGIATAELISVLKKTEETLLERINRVHSTVWYIQKDQDVSQIVESISKIETETITEVSEKIEKSHFGFVTGVAHQCNHINETEQVTHHDEHTLKASLTVQEIKVTVREWLRTLAEKVSVCSQKGQSSEEIEAVIAEEKKHLFDYLDLSAKKISEHLKSEEKSQVLITTVETVKTTITKSTTEIHKVGVEFSGKTTGYGGYGQMTSIINEHEHLISEALVVYETKTIAVQKPAQPKDEKPRPVEKTKDSRTVVTVEYLITTIHTWLEELMVEVSEVSKHEHDLKRVTEQITKVVNDAKEFITIELNTVSKKVVQTKSDQAQGLVNIIEWTRGMVLQSTTQIQQVGINSAVSFSSTGGLEQMRPLISATEAQIKVALERSSKVVKIEIERKSSHAEKYEIIKETRKQERIKSKSEKAIEIEKKKIESEKKAKLEKEKAEKKRIQTEKAKIEKARIEKEKIEKAKLEKKEHVEEDSDCSSDSDSDFDESDTEVQLKKAKKDVQKVIATGAVLSVSLIVREWYEKLIKDVSSRAKIGGSHSDSDIEAIVKKSTLVINEKLRLLSENAHITLSDTTTTKQYRQSIEWAKSQITQSTLQIQTIGINSAISATSKTGGIEQMRPIAVSIQQQIDTETQRYKLVSEKKSSAITKVESKPVNKIEHQENAEKVATVKTAITARKDYIEKLQTNATQVISESKVAVLAWYSQVIRDVSIRVHQGGNNVKEDVAIIIEKSKASLNETLKCTHKKFVTSVDVYEEDESFSVVESQIQETLKVVQKTAETKIVQVQEITVKYQSESEVTEKLSAVLESSKNQLTETLDTTQKKIVQVVKEEIAQRDSTVTIVETVEHVKVTVASWKTKITEEIHAISIDQTIENKEERITQLIQETNSEVEKVTKEAKTKIDESFNSVKNVSKSKQKDLITTIDYVHETFITDAKRVQEVSVESLHKSEVNVKESISSIFDSSRSKIDSFLTRATAVVVGTATAAVAVHAIKKKQHEKEKIEKKEQKKTKKNEVPLSAHDNVMAITQWFELFTHRVSSSVRQQSGDVIKNITEVTEHAEQEINEIIKTARNDFVKRLSHENMDQEAYDLTIKHYEESLESARVSIMAEVTEVKKISIESHKTGRLELLDVQLEKLVVQSSERIKIAMESTVSVTHETHTEGGSPVLNIEIDQNQEIIGDQQIDFEKNEESIQLTHEEKVKKEKLAPSLGKVAAGSAAIGIAAGGVLAHELNKKDQVKHQEQKKTEASITKFVKYETGVASIEAVHVVVSEWFKTLVQKVSVASKSGASTEQITVIVQESRTELTQFIEHVKTAGSAHCTSSVDEKQFVSKIDWVSSVAYAQATQIQQIGINASVSKSDLTAQMTSLATASFHQIEVTLEQMKTSINFHQKINKISGKPKTQKVPKPSKAITAVDKTKVAYSVVQETRVATVGLLVSLTETIVERIRRGGVNVEEDIHRIVETAENEVTKIFEKSKKTSSEVDEKTRIQIENALTTVHKTVEEQITEVKTVTVKTVGSKTTTAEKAVEKVLEVSEESQKKIESGFVSVSATITASLVTVNQTAQKATKTVQSWFSDLTDKINHLLEVSDCSAEETQTKINTVIAEAEVDMKKKIATIQQETSASHKNTTAEISTDHHLDVFFGNIKSSVENQLKDVKVAIQDKNKINKFSLNEILQKTEGKLKQEVNTHYVAVQQITNVDHITGTEQQVIAQAKNNRHGVYKDTIEKVAVGTAAVVAAAAAAMEIHKKTQKTENTSVEVIEESSIESVRTRVNTWITVLTERVITRTKQGGQNVSADVSEIVKSAQEELETIIGHAKSEHPSQTTSVSSHTYSHTLEWIRTTAVTQSTQITEIVSHSSTSSIDMVTQIENHVSITKHQINSAFEAHKKTEFSTAIVQSDDKVKLSTDDTAIEVVSDQTKHENIVQVVTETREQTQKRITLETTLIVQERKTEITNWLVLLMENITTIIHGNSQSIRADIFARLEIAEREVETYIEETKKRFFTITSSSVSNKIDVDTQKLATTSIKQCLDCIENIRTTLIIQISVVREVFTRIEVEDIDVITERLHAIVDRAQQRVHHTFDSGIELAINSAFEGKVVTWTETATIPDSFKSVRTIAYDLAGTVINYRKSLHEVWKKIVAPKNNIVLSTMDFALFANDWYGAFTEIKKEHFASKRPTSDDIILHEALVHILKRFYVSDSFNQAEIEELCESWRKVGTYEDASIGVRRIKSQKEAKYATIAISDTFSTRTMVELAQSNCLCWHAQFSYDMFTHSAQTTASESLIQGTIQLLGLDRASELAIVTANTQLASAAKKHGCHAVLIERERTEHSGTEYDIKVDGLDVFGESVQSFLEHKTMTQVWEDKQAPSAPIVWAQKVKSIFN